jgi:hypothetical protein
MKGLLLLAVCTFAWLLWVPAVLAERHERGEKGGVSIMPVIPLYPLLAWGVGLALNYLKPDLGLYLVGGTHIVLAAVLIASTVRSAIRIKARNRK